MPAAACNLKPFLLAHECLFLVFIHIMYPCCFFASTAASMPLSQSLLRRMTWLEACSPEACTPSTLIFFMHPKPLLKLSSEFLVSRFLLYSGIDQLFRVLVMLRLTACPNDSLVEK